MVTNSAIFFDWAKLADLTLLIDGELTDFAREIELKKEIAAQLKCKECQIVLSKYASKMDLEHFKQQLII